MNRDIDTRESRAEDTWVYSTVLSVLSDSRHSSPRLGTRIPHARVQVMSPGAREHGATALLYHKYVYPLFMADTAHMRV